jgi:hypothetical protein
MSMRPWLRTGSLIVGGMLMLATAACGNANAAPLWNDGSPSASADPSATIDAAGATASPAASTSPSAQPTKSTAAPAGKKTERPAATTGGARVSVVRAGGIGGVSQTLTVEADGSWTYQERSRGGKQSGKLSAGQRQQLQGLLADPALARERGSQSTCDDGFAYAVTSGSAVVFWRECGDNGPKTASAIVRLLTGVTPL